MNTSVETSRDPRDEQPGGPSGRQPGTPSTDRLGRTPALHLRGVGVAHDGADILAGVDLTVAQGDVLALLGRNGVGKTSLLNAIFNLGPRVRGEILVKGQAVMGWPTHRIANLGVGLVPQGRGVFAPLSVSESLRLATLSRRDVPERWTLPRVYDAFPRLHDKRRTAAGALSGGERQMLALARALLTQADLLILDEPSEGLSPKAVDDLLVHHLPRLAAEGMTVVLVEQNLALCLQVAQRAAVLAQGRVAYDGTIADLRADRDLQHRLLGV